MNSDLRKFLSNLGYGGIRGIVFVVNTVVLVPVLIFHLGKEQFALLAIVTPFLRYGFSGVLDLGLAAACIRYISGEVGKGNQAGINRYVSSAFVLYLGLAIVLLVTYYLLSPFVLPHLFSNSSGLSATIKTLFDQTLWIYCLFLLSNPFFALLTGIQKVHLTHVVGTVSLLAELGGILFLVPFGLTLTRVMWVYALNAAVGLALAVILARRHFPALQIAWQYVARTSTGDLLGYAARYFVTISTAMANPILDKLILARFVGLPLVAFYEAAARLVEVLKRVTQLVLLPVFPMAGEKQQVQSLAERHRSYVRLFSLNTALNLGLYLIPVGFASQIFRVWLGPQSRPAGLAFIVLAITSLCLALIGPATLILAGTGRLKMLVVTGAIGLVLNVTLSPLLAKHLGFPGLLAGSLIAYGLVSLCFLAYTLRLREFSLPVEVLLRSAALAVGATVLPGLISSQLWRFRPEPTSLLPLGLAGLSASGIYAAFIFTQRENRWILMRVLGDLRRPSG